MERIEGLTDTLKFFDAQPANAKRLVNKAMKDGAKAGAKAIRREIPTRWRKLIRTSGGVDARSEIWSRFGAYNNRVAQGHQPKQYEGRDAQGITDWFKFYWLNYGTLARRDQSHNFTRKVRPKVPTRRNNIGVAPRNWFDRAVPAGKQGFKDAFEASVQRNYRNELLKR